MDKLETSTASMAEESGGWADLPWDVVAVILNKLCLLPDYIRFAAVCKSWQSVALREKGRRMSTIYKEPPLLLIPTPDKSKDHRDLYSICEGKVYNCRLKVPYCRRGCGSSYGWWAIAEQNLSITLLNPFSGERIHLPKIMEDYYKDDRDERYPLVPEMEAIHRVILSCDPSVYPDDYTVAAIYDFNPKVAFIRSGEQSWTYAFKGFTNVNDILFHKGKLYAVNGWNQLITVEYIHDSSNADSNRDPDPSKVEYIHDSTGPDSNRDPDPSKVEYIHDSTSPDSNRDPDPSKGGDDDDDDDDGYSDYDGPDVDVLVSRRPTDYSEYSMRSYLVESSKGDLLLLRRLNLKKTEVIDFRNVTINFKVYKLKKISHESSIKEKEKETDEDEEDEFEWVEIQRLDDDDAIFVGDNHSICIPASRFPHCRNNSVYYTDDCTERSSYRPFNAHDVGVFHIDDRKIRKFFRLSRSMRYMSPATWIFPTFQ